MYSGCQWVLIGVSNRRLLATTNAPRLLRTIRRIFPMSATPPPPPFQILLRGNRNFGTMLFCLKFSLCFCIYPRVQLLPHMERFWHPDGKKVGGGSCSFRFVFLRVRGITYQCRLFKAENERHVRSSRLPNQLRIAVFQYILIQICVINMVTIGILNFNFAREFQNDSIQCP